MQQTAVPLALQNLKPFPKQESEKDLNSYDEGRQLNPSSLSMMCATMSQSSTLSYGAADDTLTLPD